VLAFILILGTVYFFNSPFYYEKILNKPFPQKNAVSQKDTLATDSSALFDEHTASTLETTIQDEQSGDKTLYDGDSKSETTTDSIYNVIGNTGFDTVTVTTEKLKVKIDERGGRIVSIKTLEYTYNNNSDTTRNGEIIELIPQQGSGGGANLQINTTDYDNTLFAAADSQYDYTVNGTDSLQVSMVAQLPNGMALTKIFTFFGNDYQIGYTIYSPLISGRSITVGWEAGISESELDGGKATQYDIKKLHFFDGKDVTHISEKKEKKQVETGFFKWAGVTSKYFLIALVANENRDADVTVVTRKDVEQSDEKNTKYTYDFSVTRTGDNQHESYWIYAGPTQINELKKYDIKLQKVLYGGWGWFFRADLWFPALCELVLSLLLFLQSIVKDYGLAIVFITVIVKLVTYPMSHSSMKSMGKMKDIQPKVTALRKKYQKDPQKMNAELMALYKKEGVNPFNPGCLPMFLQMPIMISLFVVLRKAIELRGASTFLVPWVNDLSKAEVLFRLPFEIPMYGSNFALMPVIMAVLTFFQNKMTMKDPNQKAMIYIMPVFMLVLFNSFPSGLVIYWTFSNALQILQQRFINNSVSTEPQTQTGAKRKS
jgi:YidC/Oxa1 family membrane protein insertase